MYALRLLVLVFPSWLPDYYASTELSSDELQRPLVEVSVPSWEGECVGLLFLDLVVRNE